MRRRLQRRLWASDGDPGPLAWLIATISLVLPVIGAGLALVGGARVLQGLEGGWWLVGFGAATLVVDIIIDFVWAHPGVSESDQPALNQRGAQLAGRIVTVAEAISGGRGKVQVGDTLWAAEGPDAPVGAAVRVRAARSTVLLVEPVADPPP